MNIYNDYYYYKPSIKCITCDIVYYHVILLGVQDSLQLPISTPVTTNTQSLLSSDQQHHSMSHAYGQ